MVGKDRFGGLFSPLNARDAGRLDEILDNDLYGEPGYVDYNSIYEMPIPYLLRVINAKINYLSGEYLSDLRQEWKRDERDPSMSQEELDSSFKDYMEDLRDTQVNSSFLYYIKTKLDSSLKRSR